jgi:hypothetical protein
MKRLVIIIFIILLYSGCENYNYEGQLGYGLEFYWIKEFERIGTTSKIINSSVILSDSIIISYDNILSYNPDTYTFTVTEKTANYLNDFKYKSIHGTPFAVTVDKQIIYTGYFWAGFSSATVDWVTIDPLNYSGKNQLRVQLGYPGLVQGDYIPDNRNDKRILDVLQRDSKLYKSK